MGSIFRCASRPMTAAPATATIAAPRAPSQLPQPSPSTPPSPAPPIAPAPTGGSTSGFKDHSHDRHPHLLDTHARGLNRAGPDDAAVGKFLDLSHPADDAAEEPGPHQSDGFQCLHPAAGDVQPG